MVKVKHPLTREEFETIYSKVPRLCVDVVVQTPEGVALTQRTIPPGAGEWHLPGGTVLKGERLNDTVLRIVEEELNLPASACSAPELCGVIEYDFSDEPTYTGFPVGVLYHVRAEAQPQCGRDADAVACFAPQALPAPLMHPQGEAIQRICAQEKSTAVHVTP